jgi:2-iminoacetate synthase ThiH
MLTNEWEELYRAAILEPDASKMEERIEVAESAMHARLDELSLNHVGTLEEYRAIAEALNRLDILRSEVAARYL